MGAFSEVARELNLPQDKAQRVLDKMLPVMQTRHAEQVGEFYADIGGLPETWVASSTADKEFGGDKLQENLATAKKARDAFGTPELTTLLNKTGLGNHPKSFGCFTGPAWRSVRTASWLATTATRPGRATRGVSMPLPT